MGYFMLQSINCSASSVERVPYRNRLHLWIPALNIKSRSGMSLRPYLGLWMCLSRHRVELWPHPVTSQCIVPLEALSHSSPSVRRFIIGWPILPWFSEDAVCTTLLHHVCFIWLRNGKCQCSSYTVTSECVDCLLWVLCSSTALPQRAVQNFWFWLVWHSSSWVFAFF